MRAAAGFLLLAVALLSGCGSGTSLAEQDCGASLRFLGHLYVNDGRTTQTPSFVTDLGPATMVDCDHRTGIEQVRVSSLSGVDKRVAVAVRRGSWQGIYVADGVPRSQWPLALLPGPTDDSDRQ
jgi:hypothetical protein